MTFEIVMSNPRKQEAGEPLGGTLCSWVGHLVWLQKPLELFFLPRLESLIAHRHCTLRSVGLADTHMHGTGTHRPLLTHMHTHRVAVNLLYV